MSEAGRQFRLYHLQLGDPSQFNCCHPQKIAGISKLVSVFCHRQHPRLLGHDNAPSECLSKSIGLRGDGEFDLNCRAVR